MGAATSCTIVAVIAIVIAIAVIVIVPCAGQLVMEGAESGSLAWFSS